jgi:hypothetical protein
MKNTFSEFAVQTSNLIYSKFQLRRKSTPSTQIPKHSSQHSDEFFPELD